MLGVHKGAQERTTGGRFPSRFLVVPSPALPAAEAGPPCRGVALLGVQTHTGLSMTEDQAELVCPELWLDGVGHSGLGLSPGSPQGWVLYHPLFYYLSPCWENEDQPNQDACAPGPPPLI